ncbi:hypothetical protein HZS_3619 [Henneguya salminicola]|nr:hypothetical protein HZS_3619 [Henneguya salminicola]
MTSSSLNIPELSTTEREEKTETGIYKIKLSSDGVSKTKILKSGTLDKILDYVCYEISDQNIRDSNSISVLFATYPSFTDSKTLVGKILERYKKHAQTDTTKDNSILS